jgi:hypothetical protein
VLVGWKRMWAARGKGKEGGRGGGRAGYWAAGVAGPLLEKKEGREKRGRGFGNFLLFFSNLLNHTFKPFLNQIFTQLFTNYFTIIFKNFHKYFKTFKITPQPKLMHSNHDAQALIASKLLK